MPRSGPSRADTQLLAAAAERGYRVSATQLERWRSMGLVPRNVRRGRGRGCGSSSVVPEGALEQLLTVAEDARQGSKLVLGDPVLRAATGHTTRPGAVKTLVARQFDKACVALGAELDAHLGADAAGDARFDAAKRATRRGDWPRTREIADWVATGVEPPETGPVPRQAMRTVLQAVASGGRDVSLEDLTAAEARLGRTETGEADIDAVWARLVTRANVPDVMPELASAAESDEEFEAGLEQALADWSLAGFRNRVHALDEAALIAAAKAVLGVESFQGLIMFFGMPRLVGRPDVVPAEIAAWARPEVAQAMVADPVWRAWTHSWPMPTGTKRWLAGFMFRVGTAAVVGLTDELLAYENRLLALTHPEGPMAVLGGLHSAAAAVASTTPRAPSGNLTFRRYHPPAD